VIGLLDHPATMTREEVEEWWATRLHLAPASRENELAVLRSFYRWCTRFDHRPDDPTRRLDPPRKPQTVPQPIGRADLAKLLAATVEEDAPDLRRAICLGAYGGLRVTEAAQLDWSHLDQEARRIRVTGKGAKQRLVGYSPVLLDELLPETGGNVVTAGGKPYSGAVLQRKVNRFMAREGVPLTFHALRKRWVTLGLAKTGNAHAVAKAAGWASIETANTYAAMSDQTLDQIAAAVVE
jgi:integrase/recombinase XerD